MDDYSDTYYFPKIGSQRNKLYSSVIYTSNNVSDY